MVGKKLYRYNVCGNTELQDLVGFDCPVKNGFKWVDGILVKAMREGSWLLLDEINLAQQTVIEGLNSVLDFRKSIYVAEIN